jgi:hypothetical protein
MSTAAGYGLVIPCMLCSGWEVVAKRGRCGLVVELCCSGTARVLASAACCVGEGLAESIAGVVTAMVQLRAA